MEQSTSYATLAKAKYVSLTTFRKTGEPVKTAIWIAPNRERTALYGFSGASAGKIKRMRRNPAIQLAPSDMRGRPLASAVAGVARLLPDEEAVRVDCYLNRKYPLAKRLLKLYGRLFGGGGRSTYFEIRLVDEVAARSA